MYADAGAEYGPNDVRLTALTILGILAAPATEPRRALVDAAITDKWPDFVPK